MSLLNACNGVLAHVKNRGALLGLHANLAKIEKKAQVNGLLTGGGVRETS